MTDNRQTAKQSLYTQILNKELPMPRSNCKVLDNGDRFPEMACDAVDGGRIILPDDFDERWNVLLFYRGHW
jgi:hypothetical protein